MAQQIFSGSVTHGASQTTNAVALPAECRNLAVAVLSAFSATAGTTGVKLQVAASLDDGATYSDFADVVTTAPTPSSGSAVSSQAYAALDTYHGASYLKFKCVNLDGTNNATVTVTLRAAA